MNDGINLGAPMERRRFLQLGSTAVVAAVATGLPAKVLATTFGESPLPLLSVGYFPGTFADVGESRRHFVPASSLRSGDNALASSGVRVKVQQFSVAAPSGASRSVGLNILYRVGDAKAPFAAWSHSLRGAIEQRVSTPRFAVPVSHTSPLELSVFARGARTGAEPAKSFHEDEDFRISESDGRIAAFSLGNERNANKLRRGVYVLAIRTANDQRTPDWLSIRFISEEGANPVLAQASLIGYEPVPFDYIALAVEQG